MLTFKSRVGMTQSDCGEKRNNCRAQQNQVSDESDDIQRDNEIQVP